MDRHTDGRAGDRKMEAEIKVILCKERQQSPESGRNKDGAFIRDSGRTTALMTP